jgi:hypothetical protein
MSMVPAARRRRQKRLRARISALTFTVAILIGLAVFDGVWLR